MQTTIHSLDYEARGVARVGGKTVFVQGALPLETVRIRITQEKASFALADTEAVIEASPFRVQAACAHYGECGGCALQHADFAAQVAYKQRVFEEQLQRIGKVQPAVYLPPIYGNAWGYRSRTRLSVHITREGEVRLGYQAKHSHRIVPVSQCPVLPPHVSGSLHLIREMLQHIHDQMPKNRLSAVDICVGEAVTACSIQCSRPLPEPIARQAAERLQQHSGTAWQIAQQCQKQPAQAIAPKNAPELYYTLPEFNLHMPFRVGDFTQINLPMNAQMVARAVRLLDPQPHERIADLFCGLGNFTLPLARSGARIVGIEGADNLTRRAQANARRNGLDNIEFSTADLFDTQPDTVAQWGRFDKMLLDPPRAGALAVVQSLHAPYLPERIVYVSCNPATLARDAAVLVGKGYAFRAAGILNLFPHTAHIEAVAWFERQA